VDDRGLFSWREEGREGQFPYLWSWEGPAIRQPPRSCKTPSAFNHNPEKMPPARVSRYWCCGQDQQPPVMRHIESDSSLTGTFVLADSANRIACGPTGRSRNWGSRLVILFLASHVMYHNNSPKWGIAALHHAWQGRRFALPLHPSRAGGFGPRAPTTKGVPAPRPRPPVRRLDTRSGFRARHHEQGGSGPMHPGKALFALDPNHPCAGWMRGNGVARCIASQWLSRPRHPRAGERPLHRDP
jgi:hypothetical protein